MFSTDAPALAAIIPSAMHAEHSLQEHREKNHVHANERRPEMHFAPEIVHFPSGCFREPIINAGEQSEDRAGRDDVMEMRDDVIGVVQIKIGAVKGEWNSSQAADAKHR